MNGRDRNPRIAQTVHRDRAWNERTFQIGDFVALLDGQIVVVEKNADDAIAALRARDPVLKRGIVVDVALSIFQASTTPRLSMLNVLPIGAVTSFRLEYA